MHKILKIVGILAVVLVAAVVLLLVVANILITPERVRQVVIPRAEEQLGRPVSIGDINVRLFSGIVVSDFVIGAKDGTGDFVSAESLTLRYQILPLLRRSVIINEATLNSPAIRVERYKDGTFNFSDLLEPEENDLPPTDEPDEPNDELAIDLLVKEISISRGRLIFTDHVVEREYQLTDLDLSVTEFSLDHSFPFNLSARLNDSPVSLSGRVDPVTNYVSLGLRVQNLDVAAFMPYAPDDFPGELSAMKLSVDIQADVTERLVESSGRISMREIDLLLDDMPDDPIENAEISIDYDIMADLVSENLNISKANVSLNGVMLAASGDISSYGTAPVLNITARLPMIAVSDVIAAVPQSLVEPVAEMQPSGRIGAQFHLTGSVDQPAGLIENGEITIEDVNMVISGLAAGINGSISAAKDSAASDNLVITLAGEPVQLNFTADNLMGEVINITHTITAERLDIDQLLGALDEPEPAPEPQPFEEAVAEEPGPFDFPLTVTGAVRVANAVYQGLAITDFDLRYHLVDNVLTVDRLHGNMADGTISGTARVELNRKPIVYTANLSVQETRVEGIFGPLVPVVADIIAGTLFFDADIAGIGTSFDVIRETLTSQADIKIANGRLSGETLTGGLADYFNGKTLEVLNFESWDGTMALEEGRIAITSRFDSDNLRMEPAGTIGLDGGIAFSFDLRLAPDIALDILGGELITGLIPETEDGWTIIPITIGGTLGSPEIRPDMSALDIRERGREELKKQLQERLMDRLSPEDSEKEDSDKEKRAPIEKKLEDTMRRLFN